ncbi:MAG TPA: ABC transporter permease [Gammaproteobacteria bacterium]|nr:ABC transporter permease [Gammaproteobacteria bacterium]
MPNNAPRLSAEQDGTTRRVTLCGPWVLRHLSGSLNALRKQLARCGKDPEILWDLESVDSLDSTGALLLWRHWGEQRPSRLQLRPEYEPLFQRLEQMPPPASRPSRQWLEPVAQLGGAILNGLTHLRELTALLGQLILDLLSLFTQPARAPLREISANIHKAGGRALLITGLVGLLIGIVMSYLSALQLRLLGGERFIVNLMGLAVTRELGPLLAAILIAGRSGSAITAELGVMRLTQELDALATMGISPYKRVLLPKVIALAIAMPLLAFWTMTAAVFGGMLVARSELNITFGQFLTDLPGAIPIVTYWIALIKSIAFGVVIGLVSCHFGLRIKPNTESLGHETTNAVVTAITLVILTDAVFAVSLRDVGWQE